MNQNPLKLYNSLRRAKEAFTPLDSTNIKMYVCGPTVYNRPHIGNARAVVVYDLLFRLLKHAYGVESVTYARNITDVDDKIIVAAKERNISIDHLTSEVIDGFHEDMKALYCQSPSVEPKATEYMPQMITMIEKLIAQNNAYVSQGNVLFDVTSSSENETWQYGMLSGRKTDDLLAGARVKVESYKRNAGDFILWKPANDGDPESSVFDSPWGKGRPGWHIECSAMSTDILGETFDIHGGGADLKFPHHENEIAQSCCANPQGEFAKYWVHNGFLTVNGEKMSKSLGNFITVEELLEQGIQGEVIRLALLTAKYNEPLDWNEKLLEDSKKTLDSWYRKSESVTQTALDDSILSSLYDDLGTPAFFSTLHEKPEYLKAACSLIGLLQQSAESWFKGAIENSESDAIDILINQRNQAKKDKDWALADKIRDELKTAHIVLEDKPGGTTTWRKN